jgi:anaerobic selenocysteine-containing dehydrogenase
VVPAARYTRVTSKNQYTRRDRKDRRRRYAVRYSWPRVEISDAWLQQAGFRIGDLVRIENPAPYVLIVTCALTRYERLGRAVHDAAVLQLRASRGELDLRPQPTKRRRRRAPVRTPEHCKPDGD